MRRIIIFTFATLSLIILTVNISGQSVDISFQPDSNLLFDHGPQTDTVCSFNNSELSNISYTMYVLVEVRFSEMMDNFTVQGYMTVNDSLIDSEFFVDPMHPLKMASITLGMVWYPLPIFRQMNDDEYLTVVWVNYTVNNETMTEYAEHVYRIKKTFEVIAFEYPEIITWKDHTIVFYVLIHRSLSDFTFEAKSLAWRSDLMTPSRYHFTSIQPGIYNFSFNIDLPMSHDHGENIKVTHEDLGMSVRYEVSAIDTATDQSLYEYMSPYEIISLELDNEVFHDVPKSDEDETFDVYFTFLGLIILVFVILLGGYRLTK